MYPSHIEPRVARAPGLLDADTDGHVVFEQLPGRVVLRKRRARKAGSRLAIDADTRAMTLTSCATPMSQGRAWMG